MKDCVLREKNSIIIFSITLIVYASIVWFQIFSISHDPNYPRPISYLTTGDEPHYLSITSDIVYHHSVYLEYHFLSQFSGNGKDPNLIWPSQYQNTDWWQAQLRANGHWTSIHDPGISYLMVPAYAISGIFGGMATICIISSLTSVVIYKFASKYSTKRIGFITALVFSFATLLFTWSNEIYPDVVISSAIIFFLYVVFEKHFNNGLMILAGAALGYGVFLKISFLMVDMIMIPLIFVLLFKRRIMPRNFSFLIASFCIISLLSIVNNLYTDGTLLGGERTLSALSVFTEGHKAGLGSFSEDFRSYTLDALIGNFFDLYHGLFIYSPIVMLFVFGIGQFWKKNRILFISIIAVSIAVIGGYMWLETVGSLVGGDPPFRYFLFLIPLSSIPFSMGFMKVSKSMSYRILFVILLLISCSFSFSFAYNRGLSLDHIQTKADLVHLVYHGIDFMFPSVGPSTRFGIPVHHPLDLSNFIFITIMIILLAVGVVISFMNKNRSIVNKL